MRSERKKLAALEYGLTTLPFAGAPLQNHDFEFRGVTISTAAYGLPSISTSMRCGMPSSVETIVSARVTTEALLVQT